MIEIITADITELKVDAIVNAAQPHLAGKYVFKEKNVLTL